jgi:hypothetical protein
MTFFPPLLRVSENYWKKSLDHTGQTKLGFESGKNYSQPFFPFKEKFLSVAKKVYKKGEWVFLRFFVFFQLNSFFLFFFPFFIPFSFFFICFQIFWYKNPKHMNQKKWI